MTILGLDIHHIVELGTQIATAGAFRINGPGDDEIFEYIVGIAVLMYETAPS